jgi:hypothetical protein
MLLSLSALASVPRPRYASASTVLQLPTMTADEPRHRPMPTQTAKTLLPPSTPSLKQGYSYSAPHKPSAAMTSSVPASSGHCPAPKNRSRSSPSPGSPLCPLWHPSLPFLQPLTGAPSVQAKPPWTRFYGEPPPLPTLKSDSLAPPLALVAGHHRNPATTTAIIGWEPLPCFLFGLPAQPHIGQASLGPKGTVAPIQFLGISLNQIQVSFKHLNLVRSQVNLIKYPNQS